MINLTGKVALITGGSRGIGAATAEMFARAGADVAVSYQKNQTDADRVVNSVRGIGRQGLAIRGDIARFADCREITSRTLKEFGRIDILVNNAGIWEEGKFERMTELQ